MCELCQQSFEAARKALEFFVGGLWVRFGVVSQLPDFLIV